MEKSIKWLSKTKLSNHSPSPPVDLGAVFLQGELEAGHLEDGEEAVAHHVGNGVIHLHQTLTESRRKTNRGNIRKHLKML